MKRLFDFFVALAAVLTLLPVLLMLYVIIAIKMGLPVFFVQARPGMQGNIFKMVKFRSMTDAKGIDGELLADSKRLPAFGQMLRATSLDELPELWNVLKGEMSLVGPRPLLIEYLDKYTHEQARRHLVRPGVTGWAQVNGRNALSWEEKFALDTWYVDNRSFWLDIKILFMTVKQVFKRDNISQDGHVTMEKFKGSE
ncbi:MAG: lipopolysaccharide/colanic/teichoic acid biosynthesis glycosyltransferase [Gammaproteobacteria bacterium]|jgi:lipopolysaccharide/colanic/teichoic acid biosynthesis glycosyltransferase